MSEIRLVDYRIKNLFKKKQLSITRFFHDSTTPPPTPQQQNSYYRKNREGERGEGRGGEYNNINPHSTIGYSIFFNFITMSRHCTQFIEGEKKGGGDLKTKKEEKVTV